MSVYERLGKIGGNIHAGQLFEGQGRDDPNVVHTVLTLLVESAELAATLPESLIAAQPEMPWGRLAPAAEWRVARGAVETEQVWTMLHEVAPLADAQLLVIGGGWSGDPFADDEPSGSAGDSDDDDPSYARPPRTVARVAELVILGGPTFECLVLLDRVARIQLSAAAFSALGGGLGLPAWATACGLGRYNEFGEFPFEAAPDRLRIERTFGDASLIVRHADAATGVASLRLGELPVEMKQTSTIIGQILTIFVLSDHFLPDARLRVEAELHERGLVWGGMVVAD